jgi:hypothetical protein
VPHGGQGIADVSNRLQSVERGSMGIGRSAAIVSPLDSFPIHA